MYSLSARPLVTYTRDEISLLVKSIQIAFIFHDITHPRIHSRQYIAQDRLVRCLECNIMCTVDKIGHGNFQRSIGIDYIHHRHITRLVATLHDKATDAIAKPPYYQTAVSHTGNHFITFTTSISTILFVGQQSDGDGYLIRIRTICLSSQETSAPIFAFIASNIRDWLYTLYPTTATVDITLIASAEKKYFPWHLKFQVVSSV